MSNVNSGSAREVAPGRLANFEDSDDLDLAGPISLPPRRRPTPQPPAPAPAKRSTSRPAPPRDADAEPQQRSTTRATPSTATTASPRAQKAAKGPEDRVRPSNVHIPVALLEPIEAKCKGEGMSHGEVIIVALEATYPRLRDLVHPAATAGGSLFASRRSRASRSADGPLTPLNYRMRVGDFETLDKLVEEFGASSRGQLITVALNDYFRSQL